MLGILALGACSDSPTTANRSESPSLHALSSLVQGCSPGNFNYFVAHWDCGENVQFQTSNGDLLSTGRTIVAEWDSATSLVPGLPEFEVDSSPSPVAPKIEFGSGTANSNSLCGHWFTATETLEINDVSTQHCTNQGNLTDVMRHEFAHVLGWTERLAHKAGVAGISDQCVVYLPSNHSLNTHICAHEIAGAAQAYGLRSDLTDNFWGKQFVVGSQYTFAPHILSVGNTVQFTPGSWHLDRGGTVSGGYTWSSSDPSIATVSSSGLVTAIAAGIDTIRAKPTSSSTYLFTLNFLRNGTWAVITVPSQPPANINNITSITRTGDNSEPIHDPGSYTLTAHMGPGDTTGISFRWTIIFSDSPGDSVVSDNNSDPNDTTWSAPTWDISVPYPIGRYTITARARARRGVDTAIVQTSQDFTVCPDTGGGDEFLRNSNDTTPGIERVYHC